MSATAQFRVLRVINVSTHEAVEVGHVTATDYEDARRVACESGLIRNFQTFRVEQVETAAPMVLNVRVEVTVDVAAWRDEYGTAGDANDVEDYILSLLTQCPAAEAGGLNVTGYAVQVAKPYKPLGAAIVES